MFKFLGIKPLPQPNPLTCSDDEHVGWLVKRKEHAEGALKEAAGVLTDWNCMTYPEFKEKYGEPFFSSFILTDNYPNKMIMVSKMLRVSAGVEKHG